MALPEHVQRQMDQIAEFDRQLIEGQAPPEPAPAATDPAPIEVPAPETQAPATQPDPNEARWKTLQGINQSLSNELNALRLEIAELRRTKPAAETPQSTHVEPRVTAADTEAFGPDLVALMRRVAQDELAPAIEDRLKAVRAETDEVKRKVTTIDQSTAATKQQAYFQALTAAVPDWETVNAHPDWLGWLARVDPLSGITRQQYLDAALSSANVAQTKALFDAYRGAAPAAPPAPPTRAELLREQVAPSLTRAAPAAPASAAEPSFSQADIGRFYADVRRGVYDPAERARIENDINRAVATGRVTS